MYDIVGRRPLWYTISLILVVPGILFVIFSLATRGTLLPLSIDFTGGTLWEMRFPQDVAPADVRQVFVERGFADTTVFHIENDQTVQVKFKDITADEKLTLQAAVTAQVGEFEERFYRSIGPAVGTEVGRAAIGAVVIAAIGILLYIAWAFRQVSHPFRYGTCAVISLVHDVLVTITFVGVMNLIAGWEVDALFLTALLTVIGYSVNDTIVVFDRVRENVRRYRSEPFGVVANRSLLETMQRSLATNITVLLVLVAILIFGGASLQQFMAIMLVGMVSGTYSSIFNATPLLVAWEEGSLLGGNRRKPALPVTDGSAATA